MSLTSSHSLNVGISTIVSFTEKVSEHWTRKLIKCSIKYDLYIKLSWGTTVQEQSMLFEQEEREAKKEE